jgi:hypothetical protein
MANNYTNPKSETLATKKCTTTTKARYYVQKNGTLDTFCERGSTPGRKTSWQKSRPKTFLNTGGGVSLPFEKLTFFHLTVKKTWQTT